MGSSVLLHYFRNRVPSRVSAVPSIIPPDYLLFGAPETFGITSYPNGNNPSISAWVEES